MTVKFNKFERVAGLFVVAAAVMAAVFTGVTAIQKGWFQSKVSYSTEVKTADGLRPGTPVTISGIRAGEVTDVELLSADSIVVQFDVFEKFEKQIRADSRVLIIRPFVIGDKLLELTVGSISEPKVKPGSIIPSEVSFDMLDLVSGKKLGPFMGTLEGLMNNVSNLAKAFSDPKRTEAFVKMFDRMDPLILNMSKMSVEVTSLASEMNKVMPQLRKESPEIGAQLSQLILHLNQLTSALAPAVKEVGPDLPRASRRAVEALDEMVVTLKALQKSFILSGKVKDVRDEERDGSNSREPARDK